MTNKAPGTVVPVIDLFAGPGGLGEGFAAYDARLSFDVRLSVEKDAHAHRTLELRKFFREFPAGKAPDSYYEYIRGGEITRDRLFAEFPVQAARASETAWRAELGQEPSSEVLGRIGRALGDAEHWVLLGGPPCQAYSTIGRARMRASESFANDHRHTLYREYLKIVAAYQPTVFVMENVKGILSSRFNEQEIFRACPEFCV